MNTKPTALKRGAATGFGQLVVVLAALVLAACSTVRHPGADASAVPAATANAPAIAVTLDEVQTCEGTGAAQGVTWHDGLVYIYGDANPGVIRQYRGARVRHVYQLQYTGLEIHLTRNGQNLIKHPTGLVFHPTLGVFLGNTVNKKGAIFRLDWDAMLRDRTLDHAVLNVTEDDAAVNGARPEPVHYHGPLLIASSDYGPHGNAIRLYDPEVLAKAQKTSDPGVLVKSWPCGPWVQSLCWDERHQLLVIIQNQIEGRLYRLTAVHLDDAAADFRTAPPFDGLDPKDELEGFTVLPHGRCVLVSSSSHDNVRLGHVTFPPNGATR